jgi:hypothetical protein
MTLLVYPTLPGLTFPVLRSAEFDTLVQPAPNKYEVRLPQTTNPVWHWELVYDFLRDFLTPGFTVTEFRTLFDFFLYQGGQAGEFLYLDPDDNYVGPAVIAGVPNTAAELAVVTDGAGRYYSPLQRTLGGLFYEDVTDLNTGASALAVYANGVLQASGTSYVLGGPGLGLPGASYMGLYLYWNPLPAWQANSFHNLPYQILDPAGHIQQVAIFAGPTGGRMPAFNDAGGTTTDGSTTWQDMGLNPPPAAPVTAQFNFYFRVRFESDSQDMEKFSNQFWTIGGSEGKNGTGYIKLCTSRPDPL